MSVKECFNKVANKYDQHCQLQITTGDRLISLIKPADNVIDLGCGTGIVTAKLRYNQLYVLDLSEQMLNVARSRLGTNNITYIQSDFDNFTAENLDLAFANMSLHWSENLKKTLTNIKDRLKPGGILAFSIPITGTFEDLAISTISFFEFKQIEELLIDWQIIDSFSQEYNFSFASLIEALRSIKAVGANFCKYRKNTLLPREKTQANLKYNIGYFVIRKY